MEYVCDLQKVELSNVIKQNKPKYSGGLHVIIYIGISICG
jgi:hypothetical protein